jgi:hypothetical protein
MSQNISLNGLPGDTIQLTAKLLPTSVQLSMVTKVSNFKEFGSGRDLFSDTMAEFGRNEKQHEEYQDSWSHRSKFEPRIT